MNQRCVINTFSSQTDDRGVCIVRVDAPGKTVNKLAYKDVLQLEQFLMWTENDKEISAVVFISGKESDFISGFDTDDFLDIPSIDDGRIFSLRAQEILTKLEVSKIPFVAAIHGACFGIGLEIALACRYRVASDDPKTVFGFPEVNLGLIPWAGGTQRLPRLVGIPGAINMIVFGEDVSSQNGKEIGLIDEVTHKEILLHTARERALQISQKKMKPRRPRVKNLRHLLFEKNPLGRKILFDRARKRVIAEAHPYCLAPAMALESIEVGINSGFQRGFHVESAYLGELVVGDVATCLISTFSAKDYLVKNLIAGNDAQPGKIEKIAVVGSGFMGSQIASLVSDSGITVRLKGKDDTGAGGGLKACSDLLREKYADNDIPKTEVEKRLNLISGTCDYTGFRMADLVIEAVPENLELKQKVAEEIESVIKDTSLIAVSASSIPVSQTASSLKRPANVIGMRFFSPVHKAELVEIVRTSETSDRTLATAFEFVKRLGKIPIVVKDAAGFYTTRVFTSYINEAMCLLAEGAAVEDVDAAMVRFGFPSGPIMLLDEMGIDLGEKIAENMYETYGERLKPPPCMGEVVRNGRVGRKNKRGFYTYNGAAKKVDKSVYELLPFKYARESFQIAEIQERLSLAMINEAALTLEEGVIGCPADGDAGAALGLGFPRFLGGPFRHIDLSGADEVLKRLENLTVSFGSRFAPARIIADMARQRKKFYP